MLKSLRLTTIFLIGCTVFLIGCEDMEQMMEPILTDPETSNAPFQSLLEKNPDAEINIDANN